MNDCIRTGIMGGTFNPIHNGHLILAKTAYETFGLDNVLFMPSGNSYMKKNVLAAKKRAEMVRLAVAQYPYFSMSTVELERKGNSYTCETLEYLTKSNPGICYFLIMGADTLFQMEQWRSFETIFSLSKIVCAVRDEFDIGSVKQKARQLRESFGADIVYFDMPKIELSSTDIRAKVQKRLSIEADVPKAVADYIRREHLYYEED